MTLIEDKAYAAWTANAGRWEADNGVLSGTLDVDGVLEEVAVETALASEHDHLDATHATMSELVNHIESGHCAYLRRELPRLSHLALRTLARDASEYPELMQIQDLFEELKLDLEVHMMIEERALFPQFRRLDDESSPPPVVHDPIRFAELEHEDILGMFERLRRVTNTYRPPAGASAAHRALLAGLARLEGNVRREIEEEEQLLFPRARVAEAVRIADEQYIFD